MKVLTPNEQMPEIMWHSCDNALLVKFNDLIMSCDNTIRHMINQMMIQCTHVGHVDENAISSHVTVQYRSCDIHLPVNTCNSPYMHYYIKLTDYISELKKVYRYNFVVIMSGENTMINIYHYYK